jgi:hypothetical protein
MVSQLKVQGAPIEHAPQRFAAQLEDWTESGIAPDDELLRAIIDNDLGHTWALKPSWKLVHETLVWLLNWAPKQSYGSRYHTTRWMQRRGQPW